MRTLLFLLLAAPSLARVFQYQDKGDAGGVEKALRKAGFSVSSSVCYVDGRCEVYLDDTEKKDPSPVVAAFTPPPKRSDFLAELHALEALDDSGPITVAQAKRMRKLMLILSGLSKDP